MKMKTLMKRLNMLLLAVALIMVAACNDDEPDPVFSQPTVSISGDDSVILAPGDAVSIDLTLDIDGGNGTLVVNQNGGFLEEITLDPDATSFTYTAANMPDNVAEGDEIVYEFIVVNSQDLESDPVSYTIAVAVYDEVTIGSTALYQIGVPADGIVPDGTTVKLAAGRSYYLAQPAADINVTFDEGSTFQIEEGATVYLQSGVDLRVLVLGTADIQGSAQAPVVMTSENVLIDGTDAEAGDWRDFQIESTGDGSNSGTVQYLRIEYAGDRAFILDNVGSGTTISHIQVWKCTDEGIFIGDGDVNVSHLVVTDSEDTQYRLEDDYKGNMQYILAVISLQDDGDEAMYLRGDSRATISNVTVVGPGLIDGIGEPDGLRLWSTQGNKVYNAIIAELPSWGVRAEQDDADGRPAITDINGPVVLAHSYVFNTELQDNDNPGRDDAAVFFTDASFNNTTEAVPGIGPLNFVPDAAPASTFDPTSLGAFFQAGTYAGAVENEANDWTVGWVKNPDGSIR